MMNKANHILFFTWLPLYIMAQTMPLSFQKADKEKMNHWVDSIYDSMTEDERIGQLFMVVANPDLDSKNMKKVEGYITDLKVGGILFHKGSPGTQAQVTNRLQKVSRIPLFIALDGEWGLAMRLSETTRFPKNMMLGAIQNSRLIEEYGAEVGRQCKEMGIHINFAPTLDVNSNMDNPVIGLRSFGEVPDAVAKKGVAYARGLEKTGIFSVAKHFPGHGDTSDDSHHTLPILNRTTKQLDSIDLHPFRQYINAGFTGMMTAHLQVPALDKKQNQAASLSENIIKNLLQNQDGFCGLCFTDALAMKGATVQNQKGSPSVLALKAGNDIALAPISLAKEIEAVKKAMADGTLNKNDINAKCKKILCYKYIAGLNRYRPINTDGLLKRLNSPHATWLSAKLNEEAITLLKNKSNYLPLKHLEKKKIASLSIGEPFGNEFQSTLKKYAPVDCYKITPSTKKDEIETMIQKLEKYDLIICGVYTVRINELPAFKRLAAQKEWVYAFFTLPYFCKEYKASIEHSKALIIGYEGTPFAQGYAAQVIFGGISAKGKLPVTIPEMYFAGSGLLTEKTRLGYHLPEEVGMDAIRMKEIDKIVKEGLTEQAYPGCQVLVAKNGMIVYDESFGYHDYKRKQKVTSESVYDLASVSKATGTLLAVMKAYDDRLFSLNTPVSSYIPELQQADKKDLTVKELLYHQSGIVPTIPFYRKAIDEKSYKGKLFSSKKSATHSIPVDAHTYAHKDFKFSSLVSPTPRMGFSAEVAKNFFLHDSFKDTILSNIKDSELGTRGKYKYSCVNFILLKIMVENLTHEPIDKYLQQHFFDRLGGFTTTYNPLRKIDTTRIVPTEDDRFIRKQLLRGYVHDEAAAFQGGVSGNAGLFSNAGDLAKVLQLYLNDGTYGNETYFSAATAKLFTQSKSPTSRRGLGFDKPDTENLDNSPCGELAPATVFGHTGYTGTSFWVDPENNLIYIFLSNRVNPTRTNSKLSSLRIRTRIHDAIYKSIRK